MYYKRRGETIAAGSRKSAAGSVFDRRRDFPSKRDALRGKGNRAEDRRRGERARARWGCLKVTRRSRRTRSRGYITDEDDDDGEDTSRSSGKEIEGKTRGITPRCRDAAADGDDDGEEEEASGQLLSSEAGRTYLCCF